MIVCPFVLYNISIYGCNVTKQSTLASLPSQLSSKLIKRIPMVLKPVCRILPNKLQQRLLIPALHSVFNEAISDGDFEFLQGKWLKITILDLDLCWLLTFEDDHLVMAPSNSQIVEDVSFSANGDDLLLIAGRKVDPDTLFFQRRLKIEGDTELGLEVKNLIDAIDLEQLPSLVHKSVTYCANLLSSQQTAQ